MDWIVSKQKADFVGKRSFSRPDTARSDRKQLVGLLPVDPQALLREGAQLVSEQSLALVGGQDPGCRCSGTSRRATGALRSGGRSRSHSSKDGRARIGELVHAPLASPPIAAEIVEPVSLRPGRSPP